VIRLLKGEFVPVAVDRWYEHRRQDETGEFYRKVAFQGPRGKTDETTQGRYACTADGRLLGFNNNRDVGRLKGMLAKALAELSKLSPPPPPPSPPATGAAGEAGKPDARYFREAPEGSLVLDVHAKILTGAETSPPAWRRVNAEVVSRDHLWILKEEVAALAPPAGAAPGDEIVVPEALKMRIARFHLVDNVRGEPDLWRRDEVKLAAMRLAVESIGKGGEVALDLTGEVRLESKGGDRAYDARLRGRLVFDPEKRAFTAFDVVARGDCRGEGTYTKGAPEGTFALAVAIRLGDGRVDDGVPPQGARDLGGYLRGK
jgi:hypothetical protein